VGRGHRRQPELADISVEDSEKAIQERDPVGVRLVTATVVVAVVVAVAAVVVTSRVVFLITDPVAAATATAVSMAATLCENL
jgi:hypothetical protein